MGWTQIVFGAVLVAVLLFLAVFYTVRQLLALRRLRQAEEMSLEEHLYLHLRARRRLVMSSLLFVLGIMLVIALIYLEAPAFDLAEKFHAMRQQGDTTPPSEEERLFTRIYLLFWIVFLLILMAVLFLAGLDFWATRRYGLRQHRKIIDDRRAMIEREISRLRQERNGHS